MSKKKEVSGTGHTYDGIEELDHPIPNWFQVLFYVTVLFGLGYFFHYILGEGPTLTQEYERAKVSQEVALYEAQAKGQGSTSLSEEELVALAKDEVRTQNGAKSFRAKCAACHGQQGQGGIGPNLTDPYWIHGGKMTEMLAVISKGVGDKGMPAWGAILSPDEIQSLTAYVRSILGTQPPNPKDPQGVLRKPE